MLFLFNERSFVIEAVQASIWESAVDIVAAKIPAKITPTKNSGNKLCAKVGKANSGSKLLVSGISSLATKAARMENK